MILLEFLIYLGLMETIAKLHRTYNDKNFFRGEKALCGFRFVTVVSFQLAREAFVLSNSAARAMQKQNPYP